MSSKTELCFKYTIMLTIIIHQGFSSRSCPIPSSDVSQAYSDFKCIYQYMYVCMMMYPYHISEDNLQLIEKVLSPAFILCSSLENKT